MLKGLKSPSKISLPKMLLNALMCLDSVGILEGLRKKAPPCLLCAIGPCLCGINPPNPPSILQITVPQEFSPMGDLAGQVAMGQPNSGKVENL